jgi:hypothetical protein
VKRSMGDSNKPREAGMTKLTASIKARLKAQEISSGHLDADVIAAYCEATLPARQRSVVVAHLAQCTLCREVVALSIETPAALVHERATRRLFSRGWQWGLGFAAAMVTVCSLTLNSWWPTLLNPPVQYSSEVLYDRTRSEHAVSAVKQLDRQAPSSTNSKPELKLIPPSPVASQPRQRQHVRPRERKEDAAADVARKAAPPALTAPAARESLEPKATLDSLQQSLRDRAASGNGQRAYVRESLARVGSVIWSLEGAERGSIRKSEDGGITWHSVPLPDAGELYAVSSAEGEVWVGGENGQLFHSTDEGAHWQRVSVTDAQNVLKDGVTGIEVRGQSISIRTTIGARWVSADQGVHWQRE